ncbi:MAG TPA: hypothetical protein VF384_11640 [Planctomycetota bacterium]
MLRFLQERVNKATKEFDGKPADQKVADAGKVETTKLSGKQARVRDLMRRLAVKMGKENDATEEGK